MQITYKFRLYPTKEDEDKLLSVLEICRLLYNSFLAIWNDSDKIPSRYTLQAMLPKMKGGKEGLKRVNTKTLQMVLFMLYNNLKALRELKKKGRKVGKLRYKKYGNFKSFILNQSGFKVIKTGNRLDKLYISKVGEIPIRIHREIEGLYFGIKTLIGLKGDFDVIDCQEFPYFSCFSACDIMCEDLYDEKPFFMWGSAPQLRKPCKGL